MGLAANVLYSSYTKIKGLKGVINERKTLLEAVVLGGELMLVSGAEIYRVEDTMNHMLKRSEYEQTETIVYGTGIFVTLSDPNKEPLTRVKRVAARCTSINRICLVNDVSRHFCEGKITVEEALRQLQEIQAPTTIQYDWLTQGLGYVGVSAFFAPMFGGSLGDFLAATVVGVCLAIAAWIGKALKFNDFCFNAFGAFVLAFSAMTICHSYPGLNSDTIIVSAVMPLVPGVTFTTAIRDTLNGDYAAGSARILEAIVVGLAVAFGVGGTSCSPQHGRRTLMIIQVFSAFWAVAMFSILTETPKKFLPYAAFSGGFAWWAYLVINNLDSFNTQAAFFSILAVAFLSHILARIMKAPVTVFLIAGILPSVPGAGIYRTVYYLIQGDQTLSTHYLISTLHTAGAIALAIFITDSVVNLVHLYHEGSHARRN